MKCECEPLCFDSMITLLIIYFIVDFTVSNSKESSPEFQARIHYLDTSFITYPLWDTSEDLYHLIQKVRDIDVGYMAAKLLLE